MSPSTITPLLLSLIALSVLLTNASDWSPDENSIDKRGQRSTRDWLSSVLAGSDVSGQMVATKRMSRECALDCLDCGFRLRVRAYSQGNCLTACQNDEQHRDPDCHEHIIL